MPGKPASFLSFLWSLACVCLAEPGSNSCPSCRLSDLHFQPRMQADKCRTSTRSIKKELVIESPMQRKDASQGEMEAESTQPVLVRDTSTVILLPSPHSACDLCVCFVPSCPLLDFKTCSACLLRTVSFPVDCLRFHFDFLCEERYVDFMCISVVSRRVLCVTQPYIVQNYVPLSCSVAKCTPREECFNCLL